MQFLHVLCMALILVVIVQILRLLTKKVLFNGDVQPEDAPVLIRFIGLMVSLALALLVFANTAPKHHMIFKPQPTVAELAPLNVTSWLTWEKEVSTFPWRFLVTETVVIIEGEVTVTAGLGHAENESPITLRKGDLATFPAGTETIWTVTKPVKKYYYHANKGVLEYYQWVILRVLKLQQLVINVFK